MRGFFMATQKVDPRQSDNTDVVVRHLMRIHRMERGLSQVELAKHIGVTPQQLQKYERGANRISLGRLARIAEALRVDVMYLLGGGRQAAPASNPKRQAKSAEAVRMLGRIGALRLLRAFLVIPSKPASLRESIVRVVEGAAAAGRAQAAYKRAKRRTARPGQ
jgi:transcriptional regulator with XRE-family HTH domain